MGYTTHDFSESLDRASLDHAAIESVIAAWGDSSEGYGQWEGGFILKLKDGRWAYLTGWCDTTGWGCQDGAEIRHYTQMPDRIALPGPYEGTSIDVNVQWDDEPADLNRYVQGLISEWDTAL